MYVIAISCGGGCGGVDVGGDDDDGFFLYLVD